MSRKVVGNHVPECRVLGRESVLRLTMSADPRALARLIFVHTTERKCRGSGSWSRYPRAVQFGHDFSPSEPHESGAQTLLLCDIDIFGGKKSSSRSHVDVGARRIGNCAKLPSESAANLFDAHLDIIFCTSFIILIGLRRPIWWRLTPLRASVRIESGEIPFCFENAYEFCLRVHN